jgi:adenosyl cobinamide kinase/adenosyl cobinamide phosphate guanylyltransferase
MLTVLLGGARSGKSSLAVTLAGGAGQRVTYLATSPTIPGDGDLADRVARHRAERPADWETIEEELDLAGALQHAATPTVIVDCITVWLGNALHHGHDERFAVDATQAAIGAIGERGLTAIVVTNEVGLGIVPANDLAREYRDLLGRVNQLWVAAADRALLMVAGRALPLHDPEELL